MPQLFSFQVRLATALAALAANALVLAGPAPARARPSGTFSCRASAANVDSFASSGEPFVANAPGTPCAAGAASATTPDNFLPYGTAETVDVRTATPGWPFGIRARAVARVGGLRISVPGSIDATVRSLRAVARARCGWVAGHRRPVLRARSSVAGVVIDGVGHTISGPADVTLPHLGVIHFNDRRVNTLADGAEIVQRAAYFQSSTLFVGDIVIGEAVAGYHGNPCHRPPRR